MVYRVFVEKRPGLDLEAQSLLNETRNLLGIESLQQVRLLNRYDVEGLSEDLFRYAEKNGKSLGIIGIDISKEAVSALRSRTREVSGVVASTAAMPLASESADAVLNIFSPLFAGEFARVLKKDGLLLRVIPLKDHLMELKQAVYETAYPNPTETVELDGFSLVGRKDVSYSVRIKNAEDIRDLFRMTPYYYKTGKDDQEKLEHIRTLDVTFSFGILLYRK